MLLTMLKGKIHGVTVTGADIHYHGSVAIDSDWLNRAGILPHEQVHVYNIEGDTDVDDPSSLEVIRSGR